MDIETQLRQTARKCGKSMKKLADESGLAYATVHGFVRDEKTITLANAARLAEVLGLELRPVKRGRKVKR